MVVRAAQWIGWSAGWYLQPKPTINSAQEGKSRPVRACGGCITTVRSRRDQEDWAVWRDGISPKELWDVVRAAAARAAIEAGAAYPRRRVRVCVTCAAGNSGRSTFFWDTSYSG